MIALAGSDSRNIGRRGSDSRGRGSQGRASRGTGHGGRSVPEDLCARDGLCAMQAMNEPLPVHVLSRIAQLPLKPDPVVLTGERVVLRPFDHDTDTENLHLVSNGQAFTLRGRQVE